MRVTSRTEAFLRRHLGPEVRFGLVAAAFHRALIAQELLLERLVDALAPPPQVEEPLLRQLTALVKTFERPRILRRLLTSIRRLYPTLQVVVVDDSREPVRFDGVKTITMPYDSGVSAGRNAGLRQVTTKYVLVLDDDVVFFRHTRLKDALALMERHLEVDIMGGQLIDLPFFNLRGSPEGSEAIFPANARPATPLGSSLGGLTVCAKVPNFFLARRDRLALVPWDPRLKRMEHSDFFTRAFGVLTTVFNPDLRCFHARTPFDAEYMRSRLDLVAAGEILGKRYGRR
jgi:glycosyltransferase involved in cell wall biosynthesis